MNREFLMAAKTFDPNKHDVTGWFVSQKFDGQRVMWDGGVSRGVPKAKIPWANTNKDERYVNVQIATGLWSRYGNVIHAPPWFLDFFPKDTLLDGELYLGPGKFQKLRSIVSKQVPIDTEWTEVSYMAFGMPSVDKLFMPGVINSAQFKHTIDASACLPWFERCTNNQRRLFDEEYEELETLCRVHEGITLAPQERMFDLDEVNTFYRSVLSDGGEGIILRSPYSMWMPKRVHEIVKMKPTDVSTGTVVGYTNGIGKWEGYMGAIVLEFEPGRTFELSGFNTEERCLTSGTTGSGYVGPPDGEHVPDDVTNTLFPRGSVIRFAHDGYTDAGKPRTARFKRR